MTVELTAKNLWLNATIRDNFVFSKTMELYPDLCRQLLVISPNVCVTTKDSLTPINLNAGNITAHWENLSSFLSARSTDSSKVDTFIPFKNGAKKIQILNSTTVLLKFF